MWSDTSRDHVSEPTINIDDSVRAFSYLRFIVSQHQKGAQRYHLEISPRRLSAPPSRIGSGVLDSKNAPPRGSVRVRSTDVKYSLGVNPWDQR